MQETLGGKVTVARQARRIAIGVLLLAILVSSALVQSTKPVNALTGQESSEQKTALLLPIQINFNDYPPTPFGSQDVNPTMTIEDGGYTLHLKGNSWKKISFPYSVSAYTVLEFDFKSPVQAEVQGIGFDNNESLSGGYTFQVYGTQSFGEPWSFFTYSDPNLEWKHYRIPVGEYYTGNMLYIVFANDHDVSNPTGESYFRNITVSEDSSATAQPPVNVNFMNYSISNYSGQTSASNFTMTFEDSGQTLHMIGNSWQKISLPYTVTSSTVIEFDFKSGSQGEVQGIGFDIDNSYQQDRTFRLYGTQGWGMNSFAYSIYAPDWKHFRIPVGKYYTGEMRYLFFANDHDISNATSENYFRNIVIYEGEISLPVSADFNQYALSPYYSPAGSNVPGISIEDNGNTLHLTGDGWTQISMPISVLPDTVLEFDFKSTAQGQVHGIGFDTDQSADTGKTFKLYGTQNYGLTDFNDYAPSAPNWKHYVIPVGQYYTGPMLYLFFANDHDVASPTAQSYFSNLQIHNGVPLPTATAIPTNTPMMTSTPANSYSYDRNDAIAYADQWAHEPRNTNYPFANEVGCGCNDCTNYISQALYNGGYPLQTGDWNENDDTEWWYRADDNDPSTPENSKTWSATDWLKSYAENYDAEFVVNPNPPVPQGGDFILLDIRNNTVPDILVPDGLADHARFLVGYGWTSTYSNDYTNGCGGPDPIVVPESEFTLLANQHCTDRWHVAWDYNIDFDRYGVWYIHVID